MFDNKKEHIVPDTLKEWADQHELDKIAHDNAKPPKKSTSKKKKKSSKIILPTEFKRKHLRKAIRESFFQMKPSILGSAHGSPIITQGRNAIYYDTIREFMMYKTNHVMIAEGTANDYLRKLGKNDVKITSDHVDVDGKVLVSVQQSQSTYEGIRSALSWVYKMAHMEMPSEISHHPSVFIAGKQRTGIKEKENLGLSLTEGKKAMSQ